MGTVKATLGDFIKLEPTMFQDSEVIFAASMTIWTSWYKWECLVTHTQKNHEHGITEIKIILHRSFLSQISLGK